jgi:hypothetical protein
MIETAQDYNQRLEWCGCCTIPLCPAPFVVCETLRATIQIEDAYDDGIVPPGDFNLALWKVYRSLRTDTTSTADYDVDNTGSGGFHTISTGSLTTLQDEEWDSLYWKYGGAGDFPTNSTNYSGDGAFNETLQRNITCAGVTTKELVDETDYTITYTGPEDEWLVEYRREEFFYDCVPPLVPDGSDVTESDESFNIIGVHSSFPVNGITKTTTFTVSDPVTWADWLAGAEAEMVAWLASRKAAGLWEAGTCKAVYEVTEPTSYPPGPNTAYSHYSTTFGGVKPSIVSTPLRFRFRVPSSHLGSYFKITYDIAEFPEEGDPSFVSQDNVVEWTGPGTGSSSDPSWLTPWIEIDPPELPGERRVVNIRYTCRHGVKFPALPQVMGEALEIPPP